MQASAFAFLFIAGILYLIFVMHNSYRQPKTRSARISSPKLAKPKMFSFSSLLLFVSALLALAYFTPPISVEYNPEKDAAAASIEAEESKETQLNNLDLDKNFVFKGYIYKLVQVAGYQGNDLSHLKTMEINNVVYYLVPKGKLNEEQKSKPKHLA